MKLWPILIAVLLVGLVFASGCIGGTTEDTGETGEQSTEQAPGQPAEEISSEDITIPEFEDNDEDFGDVI